MPHPDGMPALMPAPSALALLPAWAHGWTLARGTPPPVLTDEQVLKIDVGRPGHKVRYIVLKQDLAVTRQLARDLNEPGTWLKVCAPKEAIAPLLPPRWTLDPPRYFMQTRLSLQADLRAPDGYTWRVTEDGAALAASIVSKEGHPAATGRLVLFDRYAIFDQIQTDPSHRRKGLGKYLMRALGHRALSAGIKHGLLVATEDGQQLYRSIGWQLISPYTSAGIV